MPCKRCVVHPGDGLKYRHVLSPARFVIPNLSIAFLYGLAQYGNRRKHTIATIVGGSAPKNRLSGEMAPSLNVLFRIDAPAGLGALAMMVRPPPVTAPVSTAY